MNAQQELPNLALPSIDALNKGMTERQVMGVLHSVGASVVTAGAGAGKTAVLTRQIIHDIIMGYDPSSIVGITFTRDAANEIKHRVISLAGPEIGGKPILTTFHSFAMNQILRCYWHHPLIKELGGRSKTLKLETSELTLSSMRKSSVKMGLSSDQQKHVSVFVDDVNAEFKSWLSLIRANGFTPTTYFKELSKNCALPFDSIGELRGFSEKLSWELPERCQPKYAYLNAYFLKSWYEYDRLLLERERIDFDQVLVFAMMLVEQSKEVRTALRSKFKRFKVDEFQDTNVCQYRLLLALIGNGAGFCGFGDLKQAIYSFRGSNCYIMANLPNQFSDFKVYNLPDNFRSTDKVVAAGNKVAAEMKIQLVSEDMIAHKESSVLPAVWKFNGENCLATFIIDKIIALKSEGIAPNEIGILYRFNRLGMDLENFLISRNVPYRRIGSDKGLYEEEEIRDIVIFLHIIFKPYDDRSLRFFFARFHQFGVTSEILTSAVKACANEASRKVNNHSVLSYMHKHQLVLPKTVDKLKQMISLIMHLSSEVRRFTSFDEYCRVRGEQYEGLSTEKKVELEKSLGPEYHQGLKDFISAMASTYVTKCKLLFNESKPDSSGLSFAKELAASNFKLIFNATSEMPLSEFSLIEYICSRPLLDVTRPKAKEENTTDVELMTIHQAKGLEKKAVFLLGCCEEQWWKDEYITGDDKYEEELRLFYVGLTRAIEHLHFVYPSVIEKNRQTIRCSPLTFLSILEETATYNVMEHGEKFTLNNLEEMKSFNE